jgi:hypothetical protein
MVRGLVSEDRTNHQQARSLRNVSSPDVLVLCATFGCVLTFAPLADVAKGGDGAKSAFASLREFFSVSSGVTRASRLAILVPRQNDK